MFRTLASAVLFLMLLTSVSYAYEKKYGFVPAGNSNIEFMDVFPAKGIVCFAFATKDQNSALYVEITDEDQDTIGKLRDGEQLTLQNNTDENGLFRVWVYNPSPYNMRFLLLIEFWQSNCGNGPHWYW